MDPKVREREDGGALFYAVKTVEWWTPKKFIDLAASTMGGIDLDPASCAAANEIIRATTFYDQAIDGLTQTWTGRVWMNPPYGKATKFFVNKLLDEYSKGNVTQGIVLLSVNTVDRGWFKPLWDHTVCFTYGRVKFTTPEVDKIKKATSPPIGSVFAYIGDRQKEFAEQFSTVGAVLKKVQ